MKQLLVLVLGSLLLNTAFAAGIPGPVVKAVVDVRVGTQLTTILGTAADLTLYVFDMDSAGVSSCSGKCIELWPALIVTDEEAASLKAPFATITRASGHKQVTMNNRPIYTFALDRVRGDVKGDGLGGVWHIVPVKAPTPANPNCVGAFVCNPRTH